MRRLPQAERSRQTSGNRVRNRRSDRSTVVAKATGGVYGGDKLTFDLVKQGNQWLIDVLKSNAPVGP